MSEDAKQFSYLIHERKIGREAEERGKDAIGGFEKYEETLDALRHQRMMLPFKPMTSVSDWSWLTVGDGKGWDAARLHRMGVNDVTASDIHSGLLKFSQVEGLISKFCAENAEAMSLDDNSVDIVLCKESFHHFPRPYVGLYEMLRVAKKAVLLIEPRDHVIDRGPVRPIGPVGLSKRMLVWAQGRLGVKKKTCNLSSRFQLGDPAHYEDSGNYMYTISSREIEKVCLGLNLPAIALFGLNDYFKVGLVKHKPVQHDPEYQAFKSQLNNSNELSEAGIGSTSLLLAIMFKEPPTTGIRSDLEKSGWYIKDLDRNPHLSANRPSRP